MTGSVPKFTLRFERMACHISPFSVRVRGTPRLIDGVFTGLSCFKITYLGMVVDILHTASSETLWA